MRAYSQDLRERVIRAVDHGMSQKEAARMFGVSEPSVKRYLKLRRETGNLTPRKIPGRPKKKMGPLLDGLSHQLEVHPDATLAEHCRLWETETGAKVSSSTMGRAIERLHWTRKKKSIVASERKEEERQRFRERIKQIETSKFRIIDETGSNLALTRCYARAPRGKRAIGTVPYKRGKNLTTITDLSLHGLGEMFIIDGAVNGDLFEAYIEHVFLPTLLPGEIVMMDNLSSHKGEKVRQLIEAKGGFLLFLPAYSPDFSPIEEAFSKVKHFLRGIGARTREELFQAIQDAMQTITTSDIRGWFRHCGYQVPDPPKQAAA